MDEPYKNREIQEMFNDVKQSLDRIETQTTRTNGRVSKLEGWRSWMTGGMAAFALLLIPTFAWMIIQIVELPQTVQTAVANALQPYAKP